ncbi:MAG: metallophosphoesterase, partial [Candidatus Krumholzibacteriota bacterium]|nr:metallophosphoesterase [Candidatus Krumholzibacteriota bacterium]
MPSFVPLAADDVRFVADTHFRDRSNPGEAARRSRFLRFLESVPSGCVLFLLGDIFDFYFEYRSVVSNRYFDLFCGLRRCTERDVRLHFIGGNHDHWAGRFLSEHDAAYLPRDEVVLAVTGSQGEARAALARIAA